MFSPIESATLSVFIVSMFLCLFLFRGYKNRSALRKTLDQFSEYRYSKWGTVFTGLVFCFVNIVFIFVAAKNHSLAYDEVIGFLFVPGMFALFVLVAVNQRMFLRNDAVCVMTIFGAVKRIELTGLPTYSKKSGWFSRDCTILDFGSESLRIWHKWEDGEKALAELELRIKTNNPRLYSSR
jgi:hypothetical protein